jgi:eukaryotic-like serine/threonine-protein kinase
MHGRTSMRLHPKGLMRASQGSGGGEEPPVTGPAANDDAELCAGSILGQYRLLRLIGSGGMGSVFLAEHVRLGRRVAIKALHTEHAANPQLAAQFFLEARAISQVEHENLVRISDFVDGAREKYYVMEYLEGESLETLLRKRRRLPVERAVAIGKQIASCLQAAHQAHRLHGDLKPGNILLVPAPPRSDLVKLVDFGGAALHSAGRASGDTPTTSYMAVGTPEYMSPEQLSGLPLDGRSDIYSLGVILYEMLSGRRPFVARSFGDYVVQHATVSPVPPSKHAALPAELEQLILRCLAKQPGERPASMREVEEALVSATRVEPACVKTERPGSPSARRRWGLAAVAVLLSLVGVLGMRLGASSRAPALAAASPSPVAATLVHVAFVSEPAGAEVVRLEDETVLGITPCSALLRRSSEPAAFEFRRAGYAPLTQRLVLLSDREVLVALSALAESEPSAARSRRRDAAPRSAPSAPRSPREGVINPFAPQQR